MKQQKENKRIAELWFEQPYQPVYDIVHECTPKISIHVPDYLLGIISIGTIIKYIILSSSNLYLNLTCLTYSLLLRSITVSLTIIPTCMPRPTKPKK